MAYAPVWAKGNDDNDDYYCHYTSYYIINVQKNNDRYYYNIDFFCCFVFQQKILVHHASEMFGVRKPLTTLQVVTFRLRVMVLVEDGLKKRTSELAGKEEDTGSK